MARSFSALLLMLGLATGAASFPGLAHAFGGTNQPLEGLWIGRFFGSSDDTANAAPSAFCGVHRSSFQEVYFQFGRVNAELSDEYGFRLDLAGAFIGRNFIGEVRLYDGEGLELLGPAKGVLSGGEARISFMAKSLSGASSLVCSAVFNLKKGTGGD